MRKGIVGAVLLLITTSAWAQTVDEVDPSVQLPKTVEQTPNSSIDLLKQSAQKESPFASPSARRKAPKVSRKKQATTPSTTTVSTTTVSAVQPAPAAASNTLDMPLSIGGTNTSVQTKVAPAPVKKPKSAPKEPAPAAAPSETAPAENTEEEDAELAYALKMMEKSKQEAQAIGRLIPPSAAKNRPSKVPAANKVFDPNAFRPGVEWLPSKSTHFDIYTQKPNGSIGSANMAMTFETAYNTLYRMIPWMMNGKMRAFVYQDRDSYLRYEPEAQLWSQAISYPTRGEIVVYDEPGNAKDFQGVFAHELTHLFTQHFFDKHNTGRIMTPTWLDEGLAVFVQDQMLADKRHGGPWSHDFYTKRFERDPRTTVANFGSNSMFSYQPKPFVPISQRGEGPRGPRRGKPVRLMPFEDFIQDDSLDAVTGKGEAAISNWYLQAYLMVRFLFNPAGGSSSSDLRFRQFASLIAEGEAVRDPSTGFLVKDSRGKQVYEPYSVEKALSKAYGYHSIAAFEDAFWRWLVK